MQRIMPSIHSRSEAVGSVGPPFCKGNGKEKSVIEHVPAADMDIQLPVELLSSLKCKKSERKK